MKRKGFTLVELLVVIAIIALLMGILMPALAKVKQIANQLMCGSNLSSIGKAMMLYGNEMDQKYPRAGGPESVWGSAGFINQWDAITVREAFGADRRADATITSSFFLLIRYVDMGPKQFICNGDILNKEFKLSDTGSAISQMSDAHDFGNHPSLCCSYSMHLPYIPVVGGAPVVPASDAGSPLCADRSPYLDSLAMYLDGAGNQDRYPGQPAQWDMVLGYLDYDHTGNSQSHERNGQNVLFNDGHVVFEEFPNCGIDNDNIWKIWPNNTPTQQEKELGDFNTTVPEGATTTGSGVGSNNLPVSAKDAYLVCEDQRRPQDW